MLKAQATSIFYYSWIWEYEYPFIFLTEFKPNVIMYMEGEKEKSFDEKGWGEWVCADWDHENA